MQSGTTTSQAPADLDQHYFSTSVIPHTYVLIEQLKPVSVRHTTRRCGVVFVKGERVTASYWPGCPLSCSRAEDGHVTLCWECGIARPRSFGHSELESKGHTWRKPGGAWGVEQPHF